MARLVDPTISSAPKPVKLSYKDQRDYENLPARIAAIESEIAKAETEMADSTLYTRNPDRFATLTKQIEEAQLQKDAAEERWLNLAMQVEG